MTLFTRTPLHVGAGSSVGAIDLPVIRERHTKFPIIPGSAIKGVLADLWFNAENIDGEGKRKKNSEVAKLFGSEDDKAADAGTLIFGEGRLLAFPVRSAKGSFAWLTCPLALARFERDTKNKLGADQFEGLSEEQCAASPAVILQDKVILEEYQFLVVAKNLSNLADILKKFGSDPVWQQLGDRLVIVNDEIFSYFVEQACEVVSRTKIDDKKGTVAKGALFNQEQVPSETMFYSVLMENSRTKNITPLELLKKKLDEIGNLIQIGGDATIGLGYCSTKINEVN